MESIASEHLNILHQLKAYGATRHGDVKNPRASTDFRLRIGDDRLRFERTEDGVALKSLLTVARSPRVVRNVVRLPSREGRIRSAERVEAHLSASNFRYLLSAR